MTLRFYGGLGSAQFAAALGLPLRCVEREWQRAREFLRRALKPGTRFPLLDAEPLQDDAG